MLFLSLSLSSRLCPALRSVSPHAWASSFSLFRHLLLLLHIRRVFANHVREAEFWMDLDVRNTHLIRKAVIICLLVGTNTRAIPRGGTEWDVPEASPPGARSGAPRPAAAAVPSAGAGTLSCEMILRTAVSIYSAPAMFPALYMCQSVHPHNDPASRVLL